MADTKEKILNVALEFFARDGYEAVSVSKIAEKLGITKSALYKHYKNKRDIFDCIVSRMVESDRKRSQCFGTPTDDYEKEPNEYKFVSLKSFTDFTFAQFEFWTKDKFASDFRKLLLLEQYRNEEMAQLYTKCLLSGPVKYTEDIFCEMIKNGILKNADPKQLAIEFYAPLWLLMNLYDHERDDKKYRNILKNHIENFIEKRGGTHEA